MRRQGLFALAGVVALLVAAGSAPAQLRAGPPCSPSTIGRGFGGATSIHFFGPTPSPGSLAGRFPPPPSCPPKLSPVFVGAFVPVYHPYYYPYGAGYASNGGYGIPQNGYASSSYAPAGAGSSGPVLSAVQAGTTVRLDVWVPADADVWVGDQKLTQTGLQRRYVASLGPGTSTLEVTARWLKDGQLVTETRRVIVQAGELQSVNFPAPPAKDATTSSKPGR